MTFSLRTPRRSRSLRPLAPAALALLVACGGGKGKDDVASVTVTQVVPSNGSVTGGTSITITGTGFTMDSTVLVGPNPAPSVTFVDATTLTALTPAGLGQVEVTVRTPDATGTLPAAFTYFTVYAADGRGGAGGNLYRVDPLTGTMNLIAPILAGMNQLAITGLAFQAGTLFGVTSVLEPTNPLDVNMRPTAQLVTIDPTTAAATVVGPLVDGAGNGYTVGDMDFVSGVLMGLVSPGATVADVVTIDPLTGGVVPSGTGFCSSGLCPYGMSLAGNQAGMLFMAPDGGTGQRLYRVNPADGSVVPIAAIPPMTGGTVGAGFCALTFAGGALLAIEVTTPGLGGGPALGGTLVQVNATTGAITPRGPLDPMTVIDALTSTLK